MKVFTFALLISGSVLAKESSPLFFGGFVSQQGGGIGDLVTHFQDGKYNRFLSLSIGGRSQLTRFLSIGFESYFQAKYYERDQEQWGWSYPHRIMFDFKPTWHMSEAMHFYGIIGYSPVQGGSESHSHIDGLRLGFGAEAFLSDRFSLLFQYTQTHRPDYDDADQSQYQPTLAIGTHIHF